METIVTRNRLITAACAVAILTAACGTGAPSDTDLRESFAEQLVANAFVRDVQRNGDEITFTGPAAGGGSGAWRVVIESASVDPNDDPSHPYKGTIESSWYSEGQLVEPSGSESNLPVELMSNGLAQDCWALWNDAAKRWEWE